MWTLLLSRRGPSADACGRGLGCRLGVVLCTRHLDQAEIELAEKLVRRIGRERLVEAAARVAVESLEHVAAPERRAADESHAVVGDEPRGFCRHNLDDVDQPGALERAAFSVTRVAQDVGRLLE